VSGTDGYIDCKRVICVARMLIISNIGATHMTLSR